MISDEIGPVKSVTDPSSVVCFKKEALDSRRRKIPVMNLTMIRPTIRIANPMSACPSAPEPASPKKTRYFTY